MTELLKNHTGLMPQHVPRMHMGVPPCPFWDRRHLPIS